MRQLVWLDLCSGLGGASQPALDRGWKVIRVDIDPRFKPDIVADVRALPLKPFHVDVLWASPPCIEFTRYDMANKFPSRSHLQRKIPNPELCVAAWHWVRLCKPANWVIENVRGSRKFLTPFLGPPFSIVPGHVFWGKVPTLLPDTKEHKFRIKASMKERSAVRGQIPYEIGEAICRAVERRMEESL